MQWDHSIGSGFQNNDFFECTLHIKYQTWPHYVSPYKILEFVHCRFKENFGFLIDFFFREIKLLISVIFHWIVDGLTVKAYAL